LLVMTACVDPRAGEYRLHRSDPKVRAQDYLAALKFWLEYPDPRIRDLLFIENTNHPLAQFEDLVRTHNAFDKRIEFISLDCNWYPRGGHYGYAELRMLHLGLEQSRLRHQTTHMIKVSGRFKFPSLSRLLDRLPENFDAAADARTWGLRRRLDRPYVTTPLILFRHDFYAKHLLQCYRDLEIGPETHMETIYFKKLSELAARHTVVWRFPCNASPVGFPAHRGRSYAHPRQQLADGIRAAARRVLPHWWI
jgi:hypothetical protein